MAELSPGDVFAGCRIEAVAGRGGMGVVYRATQLDLGRPVALKLLAPARASDPDFRERFQRESRMAAAIDHPNVIPVYAAGEQDGALFLVMRYVAGTDLQAQLRAPGAVEPGEAAGIVAQVGSALDAAHAAGLVHRDVKPANVLLTGSHAYLSDFGLTRLAGSDTAITESGQWIGTVEYCAPEQLRGERVDARADVYSLACVLYAALTGRPPFAEGTVPATMLAHLRHAPPRPSDRGAPPAFDRVLLRALAKRPEDRFPSAGDLGRAALAAARGEPVTESERSVAVGPAAPGPGDPTRVLDGDGEAATAWSPEAHRGSDGDALTAWDRAAHRDPDGDAVTAWSPEAPGRAGARAAGGRTVHGRHRGRWLTAASLLVLLVAAAAALGQVLDATSEARSGPLTEDEVREAAQAFADAYTDEDPGALGRSLARDVRRVLPGGPTEGRDAVVAQYEQQFDGRVEGYALDDLQVTDGTAGRASGTYRVEREDGETLEGRIAFGVKREGSRPRIGLIAATPAP